MHNSDRSKLTKKQEVLVQQLDKVLQLLEEHNPDGFILCKREFDGRQHLFAVVSTQKEAEACAAEMRGVRARPFMFLDEE